MTLIPIARQIITMGLIRDLLDRMRHGDFEKARDEGMRISDLAVLREIKDLLEAPQDDVEQMYCYWLLSDLARNTKAPQVADYMMERVAAEKSVKLRKLILSNIFLLQGISNGENAIAALKDKSRDVRHAAVNALGACSNAKSEEALIEVINLDNDPEATRRATIALARMGTKRSVDVLVSLFRRLPRNKQHEVTVSAALLALARIGAKHSLPLATEELNASKSGVLNWACMLVIWQHGTDEQVDLVVSRLTAFIKQKKRQDFEYVITMIETEFGNEISAGVSFLQKFPNERVESFLAFLRQNRSLLFEREQHFVAARVKGFDIG